MFDLELERVRKEVEKVKAERVLVQLPAGLMEKADEIEKAIGCETLFWAKPCYGACDIATWAPLDVDLIVAYGHSGEKRGVLFVEGKSRKEIELQFEPDGVIGLIYTIQFREQALRIKKELERRGKRVLFGEPGKMATYPGQVTGCDIEAATSIEKEVDLFIFVGEGGFHKRALKLKKPVFDCRGERIERERKERLALVFSLSSFGILLSIKPGQRDEKLALKLKEELEKMGKKVLIIAGDDFDPRISNYPVEAFVTSACPRLADDSELFGKPILSAEEVFKAVQLRE